MIHIKLIRYSFIVLLFGIFVQTHAQKVDTVINMGIYKSYFSNTIKEPLYVTYNLYKGGGDCSRKGMSFAECGINSIGTKEYKVLAKLPLKYEKGHLANAEDFAGNCVNLKKTFCYYNAIPQPDTLNNGIWKKWEKTIRELSQTQRIFVIAGAIHDKKLNKNGVAIPKECYKIVIDTKTKKVLYCMIFPNNNSNSYQDISLEELKKKLGYWLMP